MAGGRATSVRHSLTPTEGLSGLRDRVPAWPVQTYKDAEAILHECLQIQAHLNAQDDALGRQIAELRDLVSEFNASPPTVA